MQNAATRRQGRIKFVYLTLILLPRRVGDGPRCASVCLCWPRGGAAARGWTVALSPTANLVFVRC